MAAETVPDGLDPNDSILVTTSIPWTTSPSYTQDIFVSEGDVQTLILYLPKTTCFPSSQEVTTVVIKNWEPLVSRPEFAMERSPGFVCLDWKFSSV